jgi:hypothetical protein
MYLRRYAHDANVPLSLRSPVSVATNRSADAYRRICFIEDSWGNHTFFDLFPAFSRCLLLTGGSSSIPPLLYPRLLFLRCLMLRFRDEVVCRVPRCPLLGSARTVLKQLPYSLLQYPVRSRHVYLSYAVVFTLGAYHW